MSSQRRRRWTRWTSGARGRLMLCATWQARQWRKRGLKLQNGAWGRKGNGLGAYQEGTERRLLYGGRNDRGKTCGMVRWEKWQRSRSMTWGDRRRPAYGRRCRRRCRRHKQSDTWGQGSKCCGQGGPVARVDICCMVKKAWWVSRVTEW